MQRKRIIPQFLLKGSRLVKGKAFDCHVDVGDPASQAMIYDAQGADEIMIVDIEASALGRTILQGIVERIVSVCRLPVAVGGGIRNFRDARELFRSGADKILLNSGAIEVEGLIESIAGEVGQQSVVVSLDVIFLRELNDWEVVVCSGKRRTGIMITEAVERSVASGAGEILLTSVDREGGLAGFDCALYRYIQKVTPIPLIAGGGAGNYDHIVELFKETQADACVLGKMLALRDYDIVRIKAYLHGRGIAIRDA